MQSLRFSTLQGLLAATALAACSSSSSKPPLPIPTSFGDASFPDAGDSEAGSYDAPYSDATPVDAALHDAPGDARRPSPDGPFVDAGLDADVPHVPDATTLPSSAPQVVWLGGPVLAGPQLVPIFFAGDDPTQQADLTSFTGGLGSTAYWSAVTGEYGVGAATSLSAVVLTTSAPASIADADVQTWLLAQLNGNTPALPAATSNTAYVLYYPSGTTITANDGAISCQDFGAYHSSVTLDANHASASVAYVVVPRCPDFGSLSGLNATTGAASAALVNAATDPYPLTTPAYNQIDTPHLSWQTVFGGGEVADMCAQEQGAFTQLTGFDYTVQRSWSNAAAKAGADPCVPAPLGEVYFNSEPQLLGTVEVIVGSGNAQVDGVTVTPSASATVSIDLFSTSLTSGPWTVDVVDYATLLGQTPLLTLMLDRSSGNNRDILHLTISTTSPLPATGEPFVIISRLGTQSSLWVGEAAP